MEIAEKIGSPLARVFALWMLGLAHLLSDNWHDAVAAVEQALASARAERTGLQQEPSMFADLSRTPALGLGETAAARATAEEALDVARRRGMRTPEIEARIVLGRVLIQAGARREEVQAALGAALGLVEETGAEVHRPFIHLERAALARSLGDGASRERELREAHRLFTEMGAPIRAEQVARQLGA